MPRLLLVPAAATAFAAGAAAQIPLHPIGLLPGPYLHSSAEGVSLDGSTAFGSSTSPAGTQAIIWTTAHGLEPLGSLGGSQGAAEDASQDGSVVVGWSSNAAGWSRAFRWTRQAGMQDLGSIGGRLSAAATAITPDGSVICGNAGGSSPVTPFRWTQAGGPVEFGTGADKWAVSMSADGSTIACQGGTSGFVWTQATGLQALPAINNPPWFPALSSRPVWVSADGASIIGSARESTGDWNVAFRYSAPGGYTTLMSDQINWWQVVVDYVAPGGRIILGHSMSSVQLALVGGVHLDAMAYLQARGADLTGWDVAEITGISTDLRTFVGYGWRPGLNRVEGWIVKLPAICYVNCDSSSAAPILNANDFQCFLNKFAAGDPYANCDSSTAAPVLTANDFQCFLNKFAAGCPS